MVLIVLNETGSTQKFDIKHKDRQFKAVLNSGAAATYIW